jgi:hypothetical protein
MSDAATIQRRIATLRRERDREPVPGRRPPLDPPAALQRSEMLAARLAHALDGERVHTGRGSHIRVEHDDRALPLDRQRLAALPGLPPADVPLVCLDTETTGLATAAGTLAFLVGLGWWQGERFRQVQLLLPDQSDERALLDALRELISPGAWLVTYNGRGFDWPLLVTRYRMARESAPEHAGHLDLLPFVRRVFRHRLADARLRTVEQDLLGVRRHGDVDGWEIPGRYLDFLRGGDAGPLVDVVRHNDEDVASLARLLVHIVERLGDPTTRPAAHRGDLAGLARVFRDAHRHDEALECLDAALARSGVDDRPAIGWDREPIGAPTWTQPGSPEWRRVERRERDRIAVERARALRRLGRDDEALDAWRALAAAGGPFAAVSWIEVAKVLEHRRRDPGGALAATEAAARIAERARLIGCPLPVLEADLGRRRRRLRARLLHRGRAA